MSCYQASADSSRATRLSSCVIVADRGQISIDPLLNHAQWLQDSVVIQAFGTDKRKQMASKANGGDLTTLQQGKRSDTTVCFHVVFFFFFAFTN